MLTSSNIRRGGRLKGLPVNRQGVSIPRDDPESQFQQALMRTVRESRPAMPELKFFHSVPNSTKTSAAIAGRMKREGVERGVHDLHWDMARGGWHGLTIEMKAGKNTLSEEQKEFAKFYASQGVLSVACYCDAEAWAVIQWYSGLPPTPAFARVPLPPSLSHLAAPTVHHRQSPETRAKRMKTASESRAAKFYGECASTPEKRATLKSAGVKYPARG